MAKEAGFPFTVSVDNTAGSLQDISTDVTNLQFATPKAVQDITGVDKSAIERLHLLSDFSCTLNGVFDDAANLAHIVFKSLVNTRTLTLAVSGQTLSNEVLLTDYNLTRAQTGELTWSVPAVLQSGIVPAWS